MTRRNMAIFEDAIPTVLENEGGYVNDPNDPGGETNFGISKRAYPLLDIKNLTKEGATAIYLRDFWRFGGIQSQSVATKVFDMYVPAKHNAIKVLQGLVGATEDGAYGSETERLVNLEDAARLLANFRIGMVQYYIGVAQANPAEAKFLAGWLKRARQ
jgi:lysozyme family protein